MLQRAMIGILLLGAGATPASLHDAFSAAAAYSYTAKVAGFGERWPGSLGHQKTQDLVRQVLTKNGARIETDDFTATTPRGPIAVHNIIGKFNVTADPKQSIFILAGHYDTLFKPGFIGANDGASSTGILLAFADALKDQKTKMQIWLVWTDLEEALESFVGDDGLYGSRHLAQKLAANGTAPRIKGFFLLDMIGDKDLGVYYEQNSYNVARNIVERIWQGAAKVGATGFHAEPRHNVYDDHAPFIEAAIPGIDLIDFDYVAWHTTADSLDQVSATSLGQVGRTVLWYVYGSEW